MIPRARYLFREVHVAAHVKDVEQICPKLSGKLSLFGVLRLAGNELEMDVRMSTIASRLGFLVLVVDLEVVQKHLQCDRDLQDGATSMANNSSWLCRVSVSCAPTTFNDGLERIGMYRNDY